MAIPAVATLRRPTREALRPLLRDPPGLAASVYLPVSRKERPEAFALLVAHSGEVLADRLRSAGLCGEAAERWRLRLVRAAADPARRAPGAKALAIFLDDARARGFALRAPVLYGVAVGQGFRLRPLLAALQREERFRLLEVTPRAVRLREGDRLGLREAPTLELALPPAARRAARDRALGGLAPALAAGPSALPGLAEPLVVVAAAADEAAFFGRAGAAGLDAELLALREAPPGEAALHARASALARRAAVRAERSAVCGFAAAREQGRSVESPGEVARSAFAGRVRRLWLDAERRVLGHLDPEAGTVAEPGGDEDVLDELAALALGREAEVRLVDAAALGSASGACAELA